MESVIVIDDSDNVTSADLTMDWSNFSFKDELESCANIFREYDVLNTNVNKFKETSANYSLTSNKLGKLPTEDDRNATYLKTTEEIAELKKQIKLRRQENDSLTAELKGASKAKHYIAKALKAYDNNFGFQIQKINYLTEDKFEAFVSFSCNGTKGVKFTFDQAEGTLIGIDALNEQDGELNYKLKHANSAIEAALLLRNVQM